jgi:hypothetical protein
MNHHVGTYISDFSMRPFGLISNQTSTGAPQPLCSSFHRSQIARPFRSQPGAALVGEFTHLPLFNGLGRVSEDQTDEVLMEAYVFT